MHGNDGYFDEGVAAGYDESSADMFHPAEVDPAVDLLVEMAGDGRALELGIGTGRIALPLSRRGVPVHGIELSTAMVARLRAKPGGEHIEVTIGDFATTRVEGSFSIAYLVFNTIMNLTTQAAQVACFRNVAAHLEPGGSFVIEVGVPELQRLPPGDTVRAFRVTENRWGFDEYDVAAQGLTSHHFAIVGERVERASIPFRYVWPAELDLMGQLAGMRLRERWSGWRREPFTGDSRKHISVWEKAATLESAMITNRSVPASSVIPVLAYADVAEAVDWLTRAFGFKERIRIGAHRAQLTFGDGAVIVTQVGASQLMAADPLTHSVLVRVENADRHHRQAARHGARITQPPTDYPYGERQYTAEDLGGHSWTFSQSIDDVDPASWGGTTVDLE